MQNPVQEAEIVTETSRAIALRPSMAVGQALGVDEIIAQVQLIQTVMHRVMKEGEHYGTIPGCGDKKTLLQPGAQKLTMTFRLCPEYEIQEVNIERGHKEYRVICTLKSMSSGSFVGQGVGCCSTMESKYRWRGGTRKCPRCGKEAIIMGKKFKPSDPEPGWLCWKKKEGCGATWPVGAHEIEGQSVEKVENDNPADCYNTVLKMAKKRAFVDATITATAASDIFTQDIGDDESDVSDNPPPTPAKPAPPPTPKSAETQPPLVPRPAPAAPRPAPAAKSATPEYRSKMIERLKARPGDPNREIVTEYFRKVGPRTPIAPFEELEELPLWAVPISPEQMDMLASRIAAFGEGERAEQAFPPNPEPDEPPAKSESAPKPKPQGPKPDGQLEIIGTIERVTEKAGTNKKGPWVLYGIKINGDWFNTFSNTVGAEAKRLEGHNVRLLFEAGERGNTAISIEELNEGVTP